MERKKSRNAAEILRDEMYMRDKITALLRQGPKTIPELSSSLQAPSNEVMKWVMGMRRYGTITEIPKGRADDYFQYRLSEEV